MADEENEVLPRIEALRQAATIISGDRDQQYGAPEDNFARIGTYWSVLFKQEVTAEDVAMALILMKAARFSNKTAGFQADTWVDIAGYAACGFEVGQKDAST
jgi:Domain of unknown function (DUF6378)